MKTNNLDYYNEFTLHANNSLVTEKPLKALTLKNEKKGKGKIFVSVALLMTTLIILFFIANAFSNLLAFSTVTLYDSNAIVVKSYNVYMVEAKEFDNEESAKSFANELKLRGGAGVVIYDTTYKVIASCYNNLDDAQSVMEKLRDEYEMCSVYTLKLNKLKLLANTNSDELDSIDKSLEMFKTSGITLIELALKLDKGELNSSEIKQSLFSLYESINNLNVKFNDFSSTINNDKFVIAQAKMDQEVELLKSLVESSSTSNRLSAEIKASAINSFLLQNELALLIA